MQRSTVLRGGGSALPEHVLSEGVGRRILYHRMHSGTDGVEIALWSMGDVVRAIGIDGVNGVVEDVGDRLPFEVPFWAGQHPHEPERFIVGAGPSPFPTPFHPLAFGNEAVRRCSASPWKAVACQVTSIRGRCAFHGFRVTDPEGPSLVERQARTREAAARMTLTSYRTEKAPDGGIGMVPSESSDLPARPAIDSSGSAKG